MKNHSGLGTEGYNDLNYLWAAQRRSDSREPSTHATRIVDISTDTLLAGDEFMSHVTNSFLISAD